MLEFVNDQSLLVGPSGQILVPEGDVATLKLAMLYEGECEGMGRSRAAEKYGFSRQRYFQLRQAFSSQGICGLQDQKRGPKTDYRRTPELTKEVIRFRFMDPDMPAEVIAQKLQQMEWDISIRSVYRTLEEYGLQKKTLQVSTRSTSSGNRDAEDQDPPETGALRRCRH